MRSAARCLAGFLLVAGFAACGGSSEDGGGSAGDFATEYPAYCKKKAERDQGCGDTPEEAACLARQACFESSWRTNALLSALSCDAARACNQSDDQCFASAGSKVSSPTLSSYLSACASWVSQCNGQDDLCASGAGLLTDATLSQLMDCMKKPCAESGTCVDAVMNTVDCFG